MATKTEKNWTVNSYTLGTWTDLVAEPSTVAAVIIAANAAASVSIRLEDGGSEEAMLLPLSPVGDNEAYSFDVRSLNITGTQKLQVFADTIGVSFTASGVV